MDDKFLSSRATFDGATIAVVGSSPSALIYRGLEELAILVNGAISLSRKGDFFLSMYKGAHHRPWISYREDITYVVRPHSAMYCSWMYKGRTARNLIAQNEAYMSSHPDEVGFADPSRLKRFVKSEYVNQPHFLNDFPAPSGNHLIVRNINDNGKLLDFTNSVNTSGTSACTAMQFAFWLGAKEIHLYGMEFGGNDRHGYFYRPHPDESGRTTDKHRSDMIAAIQLIVNAGVPIIIHGPSSLNCVSEH